MAVGPAVPGMQFGTQDVAGLLVGLSSESRSLTVGSCQPEAPPSVSTRAGSLPPAGHPNNQQQQQGRQPSPLGRTSPSAIPGTSEGPGGSGPSTLQATSRHNVLLPGSSVSPRQAVQAASAAAGVSRSLRGEQQRSGGGSAHSCQQQEQQRPGECPPDADQQEQDTPAPGPPPQAQAPALQVTEQAASGSVGGQSSQGQRQGSAGQQQQQQQERPTSARMQQVLQRSVGSSARANSSTRGGGKRGSSASVAPPRKMRSVLDLFAAADGQGSSESMRTAQVRGNECGRGVAGRGSSSQLTLHARGSWTSALPVFRHDGAVVQAAGTGSCTIPSLLTRLLLRRARCVQAAAAAGAAGPKVLVLSSARGEQESLVLKCVEKLGRARIDQTVTE